MRAELAGAARDDGGRRLKDILSMAVLATIVSAGAVEGAAAGTNFITDPYFTQSLGIDYGNPGYGTGGNPNWGTGGGWPGYLHSTYAGQPGYLHTGPGFNTAVGLTNWPGATPGNPDGWIYPNPLTGSQTYPTNAKKYWYADTGVNYQSTYLYQNISTPLVVGQTYQLTFKDAYFEWNSGGCSPNGVNGCVQPDVYWQVTLGGTKGQTQSTQDHLIDPVNGSGWYDETMTFTVQAGWNQQIAFQALQLGTDAAPPMALLAGPELIAVPEPSTWAMVMAGFVALGTALAVRRRTAPAV